jgi:serine/threonine-protein kinase
MREDPLGWLEHTLDDRVTIEAFVGAGGFGLVYRGTHLGFREPVAVKFLNVAARLDPDERARVQRDFRNEARLLHRLSRRSTSIVQALDVGAAESPRGIWCPYIVMEWLDGQTLHEDAEARAQRGLPLRTMAEAVELLTPIASALAVAHADGVAHLDVKPQNIFLTEARGESHAKLLDFGVATVLASSQTLNHALSVRGAPIAFTPLYAAP